MQNAVATSAACGFPTAFFGVISLILLGLDETVNVLPYTTGYLYWPAFLSMVIPSVFMAQVGARVAHKIKAESLRKIFAIFLLLVSIDMLKNAAVDMVG